MGNQVSSNPAELAAQQALESVINCMEQKKSFVLEAGAGAGKTYTLIKCLQYLIQIQGKSLQRKNQKIACITFTNVATEEIKSRIDSNPIVIAETIHSFCWSLIKNFQPAIRNVLPSIGTWATRIDEDNILGDKPIKYDLGYPKLKDDEILLSHDDVLGITTRLLEKEKFQKIFADRFPILLIDEYQDTDTAFVNAIKTHFIDTENGPFIGFFGDHWQKIYGKGCGKIESSNLTFIGKRANFRSEKRIVEMLNRLRPDLTQEVSNPHSEGSIKIFHTNNWTGQRRSERHWKDDLPIQEAHNKLKEVIKKLTSEGWDMNPKTTKILMLTHSILAEEQGYKNIASICPRTESYIKKENDLISFLVDTVEPLAEAYEKHKFGEMFSILKEKVNIKTHADKLKWVNDMDQLVKLRNEGTIGDVIELLKRTHRPQITEKIENNEAKLNLLVEEESTLAEDERSRLEVYQQLKTVPYKEIKVLTQFINDKTPFSTKHGVKGAEFDNVIIVIGGGWNQYNFGQMLEWVASGIPSGKEATFERNRNLFYVTCSRPKKRLALLFTQKLSSDALETLSTWFTKDAISTI